MDDPPQHPFSLRRILPLAMLIAAGAVFFAVWGNRHLSFATLAANREWLAGLIAQGGGAARLGFILAYAALVALSVPGAWILTVASGFLFGPWLGTGFALVGATLGASAVFLAARLGLADLLARAGPRVQRLDAGFRADAFHYLLALRLIPIFPFWIVNIVAGATGMRLATFVAASFLGMIPATFVFANLGHGLGELIAEGRRPGFHVLMRPGVLLPIIALAALALLPVAYRRWRAGRGKEPARAHR